MSMPIQRQSESYGYFDEGPRFARDRQSTELPRGLAGVINSMGPRITGGMLNTRTATEINPALAGTLGSGYAAPEELGELDREHHEREFPHGDYAGDIYPADDDHAGEYWPGHQASRLAVNVDGMDDHAYHTELPSGPGGDWIGDEDGYRAPRREWNPNSGYEPTDEDERRSELVGEDDTSEYNWGPEPGHDPGLGGPSEPAPDYSLEDPSFGEYDKPLNDWEHGTESHQASRHPFDREAAVGGHDVPWEEDGEGGWHHPVGGFRVSPSDDEPGSYQLLAPHVGRGGGLAKVYFPHPDPQALMEHATYMMGGPRPTTKVSFAPAPPVPGASAYQPGHRVGLNWRDKVIPGTVIGLDGPHVAVRWDDAQHSSEEPHNIHLL